MSIALTMQFDMEEAIPMHFLTLPSLICFVARQLPAPRKRALLMSFFGVGFEMSNAVSIANAAPDRPAHGSVCSACEIF